MQRRSLKPGDRVKVNVKGRVFTAELEKVPPKGYLKLREGSHEPRATWIYIYPRRVVEKVQPKEDA